MDNSFEVIKNSQEWKDLQEWSKKQDLDLLEFVEKTLEKDLTK